MDCDPDGERATALRLIRFTRTNGVNVNLAAPRRSSVGREA
jgi:hypothetical protein